MNMATPSYSRDCSPAVVVPGRGADKALITCSECGETDEWQMHTRCPSERVLKTFSKRGWFLGRKPLCPTHNHASKEKPVTTPTPTNQAAKAQVQMVRLLSDHFDPDKGAYAAGWSDAKIAENVGLSPKVVTSFRDAGFGPIKEPEEIAKLAREIETFRGMVKDADVMLKLLQGELETLEGRLSDVRKRYS